MVNSLFTHDSHDQIWKSAFYYSEYFQKEVLRDENTTIERQGTGPQDR